jgi:hypothetical protein
MIYIIEFWEEIQYEGSWITTFPIEFDGTLEELELEFEIASENHKDSQKRFVFGGVTFPKHFHFYHRKKWCYEAPRIFTIDGWVENFKQRQKDEYGQIN